MPWDRWIGIQSPWVLEAWQWEIVFTSATQRAHEALGLQWARNRTRETGSRRTSASGFWNPVTAPALQPFSPESHLVWSPSCYILTLSPGTGRWHRLAIMCSLSSKRLWLIAGRRAEAKCPRAPSCSPQLHGQTGGPHSLSVPGTLRNNWPCQRSRDKISLFLCIVPLFFQRKRKGNQGEFSPMISKAKVIVNDWLFPECLGFWSVWLFVFLSFFFFLKLMNKRGWCCLAKICPSCFDGLVVKFRGCWSPLGSSFQISLRISSKRSVSKTE